MACIFIRTPVHLHEILSVIFVVSVFVSVCLFSFFFFFSLENTESKPDRARIFAVHAFLYHWGITGIREYQNSA